MTDWRPLAANALVLALAAPASRAFRRAGRDVAATQADVLRRILHANADADFGRRHGFAAIRSVDDYRAQVPLSGYEDYREAVARIAAGEPRVLTVEPVRLLEPTSGSSAAPKLVPYTAGLQREFQQALLPWLADLYRRDRRLMCGPAYWSVTPVARREARTAGGVPIGFDDDTEYLGPIRRRLVRATLAVPPEIRRIDDVETFRYATLRALVCRPDLTLVSVWSPSFLSLLLARLPDWGDRLARDVPDRARAAVVRAACRLAAPTVRHRRLWPWLRLVSCWADGASARYAQELASQLPGVAIQGKGLLATEGVVSIPLGGAIAPALAVRSHFFEFLPADGGPARAAHELERGRRYGVVLTTGGGLYRYRLGDVVEVAGWRDTCPLLRFVGREGVVSDHFGEKLHEADVRETLDRLLARHGVAARFAMLACEGDGAPGTYTAFIEAPDSPDAALARLGADLEAALGERYHYRYCRDLGQLKPVAVFRIESDGVDAYLARQRARGQRLGDIKLVALARDGGWSEAFRGYRVGAVPAAVP